ncbi:MAG: cellulase family glycosylhydrolase [Candidatus Hydrogenedentota bacterium]
MRISLWIAAALLFGAASASATPGSLTIRDGQFYDAAGRNLILHGVNIGYAPGSWDPPDGKAQWRHGGPEAFARIQAWGYNVVRLVIYWSAVEPEPGVYDADFLDSLDEKVAWAKNAGLYIILDMHQDLWGQDVPGARGAPEWAIGDAATVPHVKGASMWSEAYFTSPRVHRAFDNFWRDAPAPDGVGIQTHFVQAWQHVAARYAGEPAVAGYDLFNEPIAGTPLKNAFLAIMLDMAPELAAQGITLRTHSVEDLGRAVMEIVRDNPATYRRIMDVAGPVVTKYDRERIGAMYQRARNAIRKVDTRHAVFTAPTIAANLGIESGLPHLTMENGAPDPLQVYAPHVYDDSVVRVRTSTEMLIAHARELGVPLFLGEWGNLTNSDHIFQDDPVPPAQAVVDLLIEARASDAYWYYMDNLDEQPYFKTVLQYPYPRAVAGRLTAYAFDRDTAVFTCSWEEDPAANAPTEFYVPAVWYANGHQITVTPEGDPTDFSTITPETKNGLLTIPPIGDGVTRTLRLTP